MLNTNLMKDYSKYIEAKKEDKNMELRPGQNTLLWAVDKTLVNYEGDELVIGDIVWEKNYPGLVEYMNKYGMRSIVITQQSSELMELLYYLLMHGFSKLEPVVVRTKKDAIVYSGNANIMGLRLSK